MSDFIVLLWVGFVFFAAVFLSSISVVHLFQNKKIRFDKGFLLSLSACVVALMLCFSIWPPLYRVYDDEPAYISQSINILKTGRASITIMGSRLQPEVFDSWKSNPKLPGFPFLESVVLFLTRDFEHGYFILNIILGILSVAVVYRIAWLWSASHAVAWWSAVFMATLPARITYSMSAASDIAGLFFLLLFFLFISEYKESRSRRILYAALFCGVYSICIKQFCGVPVILGLALALYIYQRDGLLDKKMCSRFLLDVFCLFLPIISAIPVFMFFDLKTGGYSFSFLVNNFPTSISYLFNAEQSTILTALMALFAIFKSVFYKKDNLVHALAVWLLWGMVLIAMFYAGGISYPGHAYSDRYFLPLSLPFVFLAAKGIVAIITKFGPRLWGALFFIILIINAFYASINLTENAREGFHNEKILLLKNVFPLVPDEAYILDRGSGVIPMISSKKSILTDLFLNGDYPEKVVFLQGIRGDLYDPDDLRKMALVENMLKSRYHCKPLTDSPIKEEDLSTTPFLCTRTGKAS